MENKKLPKGITTNVRYPGKFIAQYWCTINKHNKALGRFDTVEEAVKARNKFIKQVENGTAVVKKIDRKLPKGVWRNGNRNYSAVIQFLYGKHGMNHHKSYLGSFSTVEEAVKARLDFIESLK